MTASATRDPIRYEGFGIRAKPALAARARGQLPERLQVRLEEATREIHWPFVGVTTDGQVMSNLFSINSSGPSTAPMMRAANQTKYIWNF